MGAEKLRSLTPSGPNRFLTTAADPIGHGSAYSPAKAAAVIIGVLILGGIAGVAYSEQRPGDCGYYINSNRHQVPSPCGNSKTDAPPPNATAVCRDGSYSFSEHPTRAERAPTMAVSQAVGHQM